MKKKIATNNESRMWFRRNILDTDALKKIIKNHRNRAELELTYFVNEIMEPKDIKVFHF